MEWFTASMARPWRAQQHPLAPSSRRHVMALLLRATCGSGTGRLDCGRTLLLGGDSGRLQQRPAYARNGRPAVVRRGTELAPASSEDRASARQIRVRTSDPDDQVEVNALSSRSPIPAPTGLVGECACIQTGE